MSENIKAVYSPEVIGEALKMPLQGIRVLREVIDATETNQPLPILLRAHKELMEWIGSVRQQYLNQASSLLDSAGAFSDVQLIEPFPETGAMQDTYTAKTTAGFARNKEENNE